MSEFGNFIRQRRLAQGLTLDCVSARIGYSLTYLGDIESGRRMPSRRSTVVRLAEALDTPLDYLEEQAEAAVVAWAKERFRSR